MSGWQTVVSMVLAATIVALPAVAHASSGDHAPASVPSVRRWQAGIGSFQWRSTSRIVLAPTSVTALRATAELMAEDLRLTVGRAPAIVTGATRKGDVFLGLTLAESQLGREGYRMTIGGILAIRGQSDAGVFYGTRTLLQYLKQGSTIPAGSVTDWPDYPVRGLMVDVGRKYFSIPWLENEIRDLAYQKMNTLHLHLSDNLGFRIESRSHPELNRNTTPIYTTAQIRRLVGFATRYHVDIIPELDFPAHADAVLAAHPELRLADIEGKNLPDKIDLSLPATYTLIGDLLQEYLPLFPGPYWHVGADEFLHPGEFARYPQMEAYAKAHWGEKATGIDTYLNYVNWVDRIVRAHGKTLRAWGDPDEYVPYTGGAVGLNRDIILELWNDDSDPAAVIKQGHTVLNATYQPLYFNVGDGAHHRAREIYERWAPNQGFTVAHQYAVAPRDPHLQGAKFHIWADRPNAETEAEVARDIWDPLRALAQSSWSGTRPYSDYAEFVAVGERLGHAPGWTTVPIPRREADATR